MAARPRLTKILFLLLAALLLGGLAACAPVPSETPAPTSSPSATERATEETQEPGSGEDTDLLLPTNTPKPTATPGMLSAAIEEIARQTGLNRTTFLGITVENWLHLASSVLVAFFIGLLLSHLVNYGLGKLTVKTQYGNTFIRKIRMPIRVVSIAIGVQIGLQRLPFLDVFVKQWINRVFMAIYLIMGTVAVWYFLDVIVEWYRSEIEPQGSSARQMDTLLILLQRAARVLLVTISLIMLLSLYNINVNALIAALGVGGLALSLAAQDSLANIISGVMIMIDQPFRVGDRIEIQNLDTWGDVVDIGLRSTRIRTLDNRMVIVPNISISSSQIVNYTYPDPQYRIQIELTIGYKEDIEKVRQIIIGTMRQVDGVLDDKPVDVLYHRMGKSGMIFRVRWWIASYRDTYRVFDRVNTALQKALDDARVSMPFDTYNIRIVEMPGQNESDT
jgi:small-conductance mechanosensitive channel